MRLSSGTTLDLIGLSSNENVDSPATLLQQSKTATNPSPYAVSSRCVGALLHHGTRRPLSLWKDPPMTLSRRQILVGGVAAAGLGATAYVAGTAEAASA